MATSSPLPGDLGLGETMIVGGVEPPGASEHRAGPALRYQLRCRLGHGGMGDVSLAHDPVIGRDVALKQLRIGLEDREDVRRRFAREAHVQGQLEHPAIVPVYELGTTPKGTPFFAMQRVRGVTLREVLGAIAAGASLPLAASRRRILSAHFRETVWIPVAPSGRMPRAAATCRTPAPS